jgi:hypothetical protein
MTDPKDSEDQEADQELKNRQATLDQDKADQAQIEADKSKEEAQA